MQHVFSRTDFSPTTSKYGPHSVPALHLSLRVLRRRGVFANCLLRAGALVAFAMSFACVNAHARSTPPASVVEIDPYAEFVAEASQRFAIPPAWLRAVMHVESSGNARAVSPKGAMGLMQLMPDTWSVLRARRRLLRRYSACRRRLPWPGTGLVFRELYEFARSQKPAIQCLRPPSAQDSTSNICLTG